MEASNQLCWRKNVLQTKMFLYAQNLYLHFLYAAAQNLGFTIG